MNIREQKIQKLIIMNIIIKKKYWWPGKRENQVAWWENYPIALAANKVALGATVAELLRSVNDSAMFLSLYANEAAFRIWVAQYVKYRKDIIDGKTQASIGDPPLLATQTFPTTVLMGLLQRTFAYIVTLKGRTGYNDVIGTALLIIGDDMAGFNPDDYIANGKVKGLVGVNQLTFVKGKFITGMETFRQRGADPEYYSIGKFNKSKGQDTSPNMVAGVPELRNYKNRAFIGNTMIGEYSPIYSITR